jgi:hypothetical protein
MRLGLSISLWTALAAAIFSGSALASSGVPVTYQLPADGPLPKTYLVTVAITDPKDPNWIVSTFVAGQPRTVTTENGGKFTETWNGLDENFMPVPPGKYGLKGIYSPAQQWDVDGEWHAITPVFAGGVSGWLPSSKDPDHWKLPVAFGGDPVNAPLSDVDVGPNGVAVFYYKYLENGKNNPMFDLNKPIGPGQFLRAFNSGGAAGGDSVATDGESVWASAEEGGPRFIYRADQKSFGDGKGAHRKDVYLPEGQVTSMAAWKDAANNKSYLYLAQRGKFVQLPPEPHRKYGKISESPDEFINQITVHDGETGKVLSRKDVVKPLSIQVHNEYLYVLENSEKGWRVRRAAIPAGLPEGNWQEVFAVPADIKPADLEIDATGRFYLSDLAANKVHQLDAKGKVLRSFGKMDAQIPGKYDPLTLMSPRKLATWRDAGGKDRLIIAEFAGPNRVSEWSADTGELLREFPTYQTKANSGYASDPSDPTLIYLPGQGDWLTRFKIDYDTQEWKVDAVWPNVPAGQRKDMEKPTAVRANGDTLYLASERNAILFRLNKAGDKWHKSAGIVTREKNHFFWNDANGNGEIDEEELRPTTLPGDVLTYHGQRFLPDLSYLAPAQGGRDLWRLPVAEFDEHGNPIYREWQKVLTDPIFQARADGKADAIHGGNELADKFSSDWMQADGSVEEGFYIQARGGRNFNANYGAQHKISRYVPDGKGGYDLKWRVGRTKLASQAEKGEIEGGMRLYRPINGILTVVDQSRSGLFLYTDDGLYVDTLFPPGNLNKEIGVYRQPGEFFAGTIYSNPGNGKIYYGAGKYTPFLYEMKNWSLTENPVKPISSLPKEVQIATNQIADPVPMAVTLRGGAGKASVASFAPALGGVELDGSLTGWESAEPVQYGTGKDQKVEVRCLYDPDHLYLRWHVRLGGDFVEKPLPPLERIFTHDQESNTISFYMQGDENAAPDGPTAGRPGDVRMVFGLFKNKGALEPVAVGMYPRWTGGKAQPQIYRTPVGEAQFQHVGAIAGAKLGAKVDADGKGFVIAAAIPRSAIPAIQTPFSGQFRTLVNFSANLGGHNKFWWANTDGTASTETYDEPSEARLYPGSWATAQFKGLADGYTVRNWLILGPFGGPGAEKFIDDPKNKEEVKAFYDAATYPPDDGKVDPKATYSGPLIKGYWKDNKEIRWKSVEIDDMDTRAVVGGGSQVWYGATWIYSPVAQEMTFELQGHNMTYLRWFLNGEPLQSTNPDKHYKPSPTMRILRTASEKVSLRQGWNQVYFRAYNVGYTPFRVGLVLKAPAEQLWPLRFSNQPQS